MVITPTWDETLDAWTTETDAGALGYIEVLIKTDGSSQPPTTRQLSTLKLISTLPPSLVAEIPSKAREYVEGYMAEDDYEDLAEEDFRIQFSLAIIPRIRNTDDHFFFLIGHSDIDEEHGVACLFKNHERCGVCHGDHAYENYPWDATHEFEWLLR